MAESTMKATGRRTFLKAGAAGAASLAAGGFLSGCAPSLKTPAAKPNLLLIITDQQHIDTIAAGGCTHVRTPSFDRLAGNGVSFTRSYCANPLCSPSRGSMFTGRATSECGVIGNEIPVRQGMPNLGEWFRQESGYETIYTGKWHLPATYTTDISGFDVPMTGLVGQGNYCDTYVSMACDAYIRNRPRGKPFFMVSSFMQPHDICEWLRLNMLDQPELRYPELLNELPELPPNFSVGENEPEAVRRQRERDEPGLGSWSDLHWRYYLWSYYRHIEMVDAEVGRIVGALEDTGQLRDTVILFTADHGEGTGHHKMVRKSTLYDESAKVPFIVSHEGELVKRTVDSCLVSGLDVVPTLCAFAGINPPDGVKGKNLRPVIEGSSDGSRAFVAADCANNIGQMIRTDRFKYIAYKNDPGEQLFDMLNDPGETVNLASDSGHAAALDEHRKLLRKWISGLDIAPDVPEKNRWFV